jgi:hypothetical protein
MDATSFCPPKSTEPFAKLAVGTSHCAGITFLGELFCFGLNDKSQCGIRSDKNEFLLLPVHVNLENDVSLLSTTVATFLVFLDWILCLGIKALTIFIVRFRPPGRLCTWLAADSIRRR